MIPFPWPCGKDKTTETVTDPWLQTGFRDGRVDQVKHRGSRTSGEEGQGNYFAY